MGVFSATLRFPYISARGNFISLTAANFSFPYCNIFSRRLVSEGSRLNLIDTGLFAFLFFNVGFFSLFMFHKHPLLQTIACKLYNSALFVIFRLTNRVNFVDVLLNDTLIDSGFFLQPGNNELLIHHVRFQAPPFR